MKIYSVKKNNYDFCINENIILINSFLLFVKLFHKFLLVFFM